MFATSGKAGVHQQHGRRLCPVAAGQNKPVDMETGMAALRVRRRRA
jgi:hypothetical protein